MCLGMCDVDMCLGMCDVVCDQRENIVQQKRLLSMLMHDQLLRLVTSEAGQNATGTHECNE